MGYEDNNINGHDPKVISDSDNEKTSYAAPPAFDNEMLGEMTDAERHGIQKFSRLGWKRLTIVLIVEAIALGSLSIPQTFAYLVANYPDAGRLMWGRFGYELINFMLCLQLIFLTGSHCLTGTIAFMNITESTICSVVFAVVSAIILFALAVPPSFTEVAILGYIDFASIVIAIGVTIIGTGVQASNAPGGLAAVNWSAWPKENLTFTEGFIAISNIIFAYSFAMCQFSFMDEMHTPKDFVKSIWTLGITEIVIYTLTGALIYAFVGQDVSSPALTSAGTTLSRVAYGIALPVIFISGSINTVVFGRLVHGRIFANSPIRYINTKMGWITWLAVIAAATVIAFIIAEVIPFFNDLLSISSALFISGFTFYFPALMWFLLIRKGGMFERKNLLLTVVNGFIFVLGMIILVAGTYSSIDDIIDKYNTGSVRGVFTCAKPS
ncbi:Amino acid transporter transmembrane [Penicillium waksmanii]|uniref:Amino acid transporter transmembrane n=1 Tax=Penicillium waksmanii TaxID=69791 RepID=UPI0025479C8E|nr:Amino acid transporter transmembrane [Penicillium waksmanii]KAJ5976421.1 Amino acid transporter transmembrane [Penicillium waksmanii]